MRRICLTVAAVLSLFRVASSDAAPLTCEHYRDRLTGALAASNEGDTDTPTFTLNSTSAERGQRYQWSTGALSGTMSCNTAGQFEEFYAEVRFTSRDGIASLLKRYIGLNGAAICALATDEAVACSNFGKLMLQDTLRQMGDAAKRRLPSPSGLSDRTLFDGVTAELTAAPTFFSFIIGPGRGATVDETRRSLGPIDLSGAE